MARRRRQRNPTLGTVVIIGAIGFIGLLILGQAQGQGEKKSNPLAFIPGKRYVEFRDGVYNVVFGGLVAFSSPDKATAEATYNRMMGAA